MSSALNEAWKGQRANPSFNPKYCKEAFELHLRDVQEAASSPQLTALGRSLSGALTTQVWTVSESGGSSFYGLLIASPDKVDVVTVVDDERPEHRVINDLKQMKLKSLLDDVMSLPIEEISDIADGSCTLVTDGPRSRVFPPGYGIRRQGGDKLHDLLQLFEDR